jgi:hypothetical protein
MSVLMQFLFTIDSITWFAIFPQRATEEVNHFPVEVSPAEIRHQKGVRGVWQKITGYRLHLLGLNGKSLHSVFGKAWCSLLAKL